MTHLRRFGNVATKTLTLLCIVLGTSLAQHGKDSLLFTIALDADSSSLFWCGPREMVRASLSGPVLMKDNLLLFISRNGYVVYDAKGKLLEHYVLTKENRRVPLNATGRLQVAYPINKTTILVYRDHPFEVYEKTLFKKGLKALSPEAAQEFREIASTQRFNLAHNGVTDDLAIRGHRKPHLVGYEGPAKNEITWWSLDLLYSFTSPVIVERAGAPVSFFPGFRPPPGRRIPTHRINPIGVYLADSTWYYYGYANEESEWGKQHQRVYLCNQFGNLLYVNSLVGKELADEILTTTDKVMYTVESTTRRAFVPAIDDHGDLYYGTIDYEKKQIEVKVRLCYGYRAFERKSSSLPPDLFAKEEQIAFVGLDIGEDTSLSGKPLLPDIRLGDDGKIRRKATERDLRMAGYLASVHRIYREDLKQKLGRKCSALPPRVEHMRDSLHKMSTAWFPYGITIDHYEKGDIIRYDYGPGDVVVSTRILNITSTNEIFVRVDLEKRAEILVFSLNGSFAGRLAFNRQFHKDRGDMVLVSDERAILEKDYETGDGGYRLYEWKLVPFSRVK